MSDDVPVFLTPYLVVEGSVAEVIDCVAGPIITSSLDGERDFAYRTSIHGETRADTMYAALDVHAAYGYDSSTVRLIGWLTIERVRTKCHLEMKAIAGYQQLACDVLLALPSTLDYLGPVEQTMQQRHEILRKEKGSKEPPSSHISVNLRDLDDDDQKILNMCRENPNLTLPQISDRVRLSESAVGIRYRRLADRELLPALQRGRPRSKKKRGNKA